MSALDSSIDLAPAEPTVSRFKLIEDEIVMEEVPIRSIESAERMIEEEEKEEQRFTVERARDFLQKIEHVKRCKYLKKFSELEKAHAYL